MKILILALLLFAPATVRADAAPIEVTAKLVEKPKQIALCGVIAWKAVVRYELISVEKGKVSGAGSGAKELLVVVTCPEFFKVGETRKLKLWPVGKNDSFDDEFKSRTGPRYILRD